MDRKMLHLAERLVIAMETMSENVKKISAYVYDMSCSVSYLVNEKRQEENIPVVAQGECGNPPSHTSTAGQEGSDEGEYFEPYEQAHERSLWHISDTQHGESSFAAMASTRIDSHEDADVLTSYSNPIFSEEIKTEEPSQDEENVESYDMRNMYGNSQSSDRPQPSNLLETTELSPTVECRDIQHMENSSNSAVINDYATHLDIIQEGQAEAHQMESAKNASVVHTVVGSEGKTHKCSMCEKSFKYRRELENHTRVHSGERPYMCNVCGKTFSWRSSFNNHMLSHTGQKPHKCTVCGKEFRQKVTLRIHLRSHTGERPYSCDVCRKAFSDKGNLKVHIRTHTGEKPYKCTLCGKAFRQRIVFTRHMRTHPADNPV